MGGRQERRREGNGASDARISDLINLGPVTERQLAEVGVESVDDLRALGAVEAWRRLKFAFPGRMTLVGLYALDAALRNRPWTTLSPEDRARLRWEAGGAEG